MTRQPRLLDLFSGAGGAARGYQQAGFHVTGVDLAPQPRYAGDRFIQADALEYLAEHGHEFDAIHASCPCQFYSAMSNCRPGLAATYDALVDVTRDLLSRLGKPWVLENVDGAPLAHADSLFGAHGVLLCGHMFGLRLYRHRLFESSFPVSQPGHPPHLTPASPAGHWEPGTIISVSGHCSPIGEARQAMGISWMTREELAEAIPPAYTRHVGAALTLELGTVAA